MASNLKTTLTRKLSSSDTSPKNEIEDEAKVAFEEGCKQTLDEVESSFSKHMAKQNALKNSGFFARQAAQNTEAGNEEDSMGKDRKNDEKPEDEQESEV